MSVKLGVTSNNKREGTASWLTFRLTRGTFRSRATSLTKVLLLSQVCKEQPREGWNTVILLLLSSSPTSTGQAGWLFDFDENLVAEYLETENK